MFAFAGGGGRVQAVGHVPRDPSQPGAGGFDRDRHHLPIGQFTHLLGRQLGEVGHDTAAGSGEQPTLQLGAQLRGEFDGGFQDCGQGVAGDQAGLGRGQQPGEAGVQGVGLSYAVAGGVAGDPSRQRDLLHGIAGQAGLPGVTGDLRAAGGEFVGEFQATPGREPGHPFQAGYLGHQLLIGPTTQLRGGRIDRAALRRE